MYRDHTVAAVVPAYNEAGLVGDVIRTVPDYVDRVYAIDDGSTDETWAEIEAAAESANERVDPLAADGGATWDDRVVPIRHDENAGVGAAIKTGYRRAHGDGVDVAVVMAGDGQMDPDVLEALLDPIVEGDADYAKGNRLLDTDAVREMPRFRLFGNVLLTLLTKIASGYWKSGDPQNGYTAVRLDAFDDVPLDSVYDDYGFANDLLVRLNCHEKRVADVALPAVYGEEESHIDYVPFVRNVSTLLLRSFLRRLHLRYVVREFHPLVVFYYAGAGAGVASAACLGLAARALGDADRAGSLPLALGGLLVGCFAVLFLGLAATLDRRESVPLETQVIER